MYDTVKNATACFAYYSYSITGGHLLTNNGSSTKYGFTSSWSWGDGSTNSTAKNSDHIYTKNGRYNVCLTVTDSIANCSATYCDSIQVTGACSASAYFAATNGTGGSVSFTNYSTTTSGHYSSSWDFQDSKTGSSLKNPTHTYKANGIYHVCLYVVDSLNTSCNNSFCRYDTVKNATSCYAYYSYSLSGGHLVTSNGSTTKNGFASIWSWGDGSANSTSKSPDHTYTKNGTYYVCLKVIDSIAGCYDQHCDSITVTGACSAHFVYALTSGLTVGFADSLSTAFVHGDKRSVSWNFGDGSNYGSGDFTYHAYSKNGTYTVIVTVYDSVTKCSSSYSTNVKVSNCSIVSSYKYSRTGNKFTFTSTSTGASTHVKYKWIYGDNGSVADSTSGATATHTYTASAATETVYLVIYDSATGCTAYSSQTITLCATKSDFTYKATGLSVAFAGDSSNSTTVTYAWAFGDKSAGSGLRSSHTYANNGTYGVCLTATDNLTGCSSSTCSTITVTNCNLTASYTDSISGHTVFFKGTTNLTSKHASIKWYYTDGSPMDSTSGLNSHHTFASSISSQVVYLIIYDSTTKCSVYARETVTICSAKSDYTYKVSGATVSVVADSTNKSTVKYNWDFNDKTGPNTGKKLTHTYTASGTYNICLTATDSATGCTTTTCTSVAVSTCSLSAAFTDSIKGNTVKFYGKSNASSHVRIIWMFGDNTTDSTSNSYNVSHTYGSSISTSNAYLRVYDSVTKCVAYGTEQVIICDAKSDFTEKLNGLYATFAPNTSNKTYIKYAWNFGDKSDSRLAAPTHYFPYYGTYQVCLTATDTVTGCSTQTCTNVTLTCQLNVSFTDSIIGNTVSFVGTTGVISSHTSIKWYFGDSKVDSTSGLKVSHTYASGSGSENVYLRIYDSTSKCLVYATKTIVLCSAKSDFTFKTGGTSAGFTSDATNKSTVKYSWNFGDKSNLSTAANPTHAYSNYGTYSVCLTATDSATGCTTTTCNNVTLSCSLSVSFTDSVSGTTVKFYGKTGQISNHTSIEWFFGDGTSDLTSSLTTHHTYSSSVSAETVTLRVYDSTTKCLVYVNGTVTLCDANSQFSDKVSGLTVAFGASTVNSARIKYSWNFGDKSDSRLAAPTHTYANNGTYQVCLTATDSVSGCSTMTCTSIAVSNCTLAVKFTDSISGHYVTFAAIPNVSAHYSVKWIFGDGVIDSTSGLRTHHAYGSTVRTENVYVRIYDSVTKCVAYASETITLCTALSDYKYTVSGLNVSFTADPNNTSRAGYSWNFGDNSTFVTTQNPTHTFSAAGTYYVCLSVSDSTGCSSSTCYNITVTGCTLTATFTDSVSGHTVKFFGKTNLTSHHSSIKWFFGDNAVDSTSGLKTTHTYASSVTSATAYLRIYDSTTKCLTYYNVTISFCSVSAAWTYGASNLTVKFLANSANPSNTLYTWYFGDGSNDGTTKDPTHTYSKPGKYRVCLYALDSPCIAEICDSITVTAATNATYCIIGKVNTSKVAGYPAKVFLIYYNSKDSTLDSIKTTQTDAKGFYQFCGLRNGTYYTKAALDTNNSYYKYFIPTYHYDATKWTGAQTITVNNANDTGENIIMKIGTNPGGAGFIGGKVSAGAGKFGDPVADVQVVLYDSAGINPVAYTYTNSAGYYSFSGIAFGTYSVYGEVVGKVCYPAIVTITDTSSTDNSVDLQVKLTTITAAIKPAGTWIVEKADVYPNPVTNKLTLSMSIRNASQATLKIYDITGKVVSELNTSLEGGAQKMEVDASSLPAGLYFLRMEMLKDNTLMEARFVKVH